MSGWENLLHGARVTLRSPEPDDLERLYRWENDPRWWEVGSPQIPYSRTLLKDYLEQAGRDLYETKQLRLMIDLPQVGETVGMVDLFDFDPFHLKAEVGVLVDPAWHRQGIATEAMQLLMHYAFSFFKLHQLYAHVPVSHAASCALYRRLGFTESGRLKDWISVEGGYADVLLMQFVEHLL